MKPLLLSLSSALCAVLFSTPLLGAGLDDREGGGGFLPPIIPVEPPAKPGLLQTLTHADFSGVTSITLAPGGKHAYAAAFHQGMISLMIRQPETGKLKFVKSITAPHQRGAVAFRLSKDGKWGAASAFVSEALILFSRDPETGELKETDHAGGPDHPMAALDFCIDNVFSPDGKFVYAVGSTSLVCFKVEDGKLVHVETLSDAAADDEVEAPAARRMSGARGIAVTPDGKTLLSSWCGSGTLMVHSRDLETGKLTFVQAISNGAGVDKGLSGVMHVTVSPEGDFAYTAGGRMGREDAVCVFSIDSKAGRLTPVQSLTGNDLPPDFGGGNEIAVSPDGFQVAVACTTSDCLTRFARDPQTGKLTVGKSFPCGPPANPGACGVTYDVTGRHLLVADENSSSIVAFRNLTR